MEVKNIQNINTITSTLSNKRRANDFAFGARVNVIGTKFDKKIMAELSEKAKKIGLENDVVELKYSKITSILDRHGYHDKQHTSQINNMFIEYSQIFEGRLFPNGNKATTGQVHNKLCAKNHPAILEQQELAANNYLDKLTQSHTI